VIVAVRAVRVVEMSIHQVINMVAMGHRVMAAAWAVAVLLIVGAALMVRRAPVVVGSSHFDDMLIDMPLMGMMEMPVVQVVHMISMLDGDMPAVGAVAVGMILMDQMVVVGHDCSPCCLSQCGSMTWANAFLTSVRT
jgi:hypothetical protein